MGDSCSKVCKGNIIAPKTIVPTTNQVAQEVQPRDNFLDNRLERPRQNYISTLNIPSPEMNSSELKLSPTFRGGDKSISQIVAWKPNAGDNYITKLDGLFEEGERNPYRNMLCASNMSHSGLDLLPHDAWKASAIGDVSGMVGESILSNRLFRLSSQKQINLNDSVKDILKAENNSTTVPNVKKEAQSGLPPLNDRSSMSRNQPEDSAYSQFRLRAHLLNQSQKEHMYKNLSQNIDMKTIGNNGLDTDCKGSKTDCEELASPSRLLAMSSSRIYSNSINVKEQGPAGSTMKKSKRTMAFASKGKAKAINSVNQEPTSMSKDRASYSNSKGRQFNCYTEEEIWQPTLNKTSSSLIKLPPVQTPRLIGSNDSKTKISKFGKASLTHSNFYREVAKNTPLGLQYNLQEEVQLHKDITSKKSTLSPVLPNQSPLLVSSEAPLTSKRLQNEHKPKLRLESHILLTRTQTQHIKPSHTEPRQAGTSQNFCSNSIIENLSGVVDLLDESKHRAVQMHQSNSLLNTTNAAGINAIRHGYSNVKDISFQHESYSSFNDPLMELEEVLNKKTILE